MKLYKLEKTPYVHQEEYSDVRDEVRKLLSTINVDESFVVPAKYSNNVRCEVVNNYNHLKIKTRSIDENNTRIICVAKNPS